jgi:plastocyanin
MRRARCTAVGLALLLSAAAGAQDKKEKTGTIAGVVRFTGEVPPAKQLPTGDGGTIDHYDLIVDTKTKGLRWVIAALEDAPEQPKLKGGDPVVIDQKNLTFVPRVVAVQHGRTVRFDNSDNVNHSVSIFSAVKENNLNVFATAKDPVTKEFTAEKAPLRVGCVLHPAMTAWVYVAPHPWVAVTDEKGAFAIKDVPAGKYTLVLRHPDTGLIERKAIEVRAGEKAEVGVDWKEPKPKRDKK